ncbi:unnamed protein product [Aphanomyces euteiches]|uniref:Uncharacterized protein n=1 Tax=Aphanomyces euteiches TaxID=100861 RepID=A0A6G0XSW6_9STRA|nr:hypothetical protein Ae201684_001903 [Aphanomyces euteiches]KAH9089642.1 hypothetical protein Ae201684P_007810 [Aphanomyces euteiches]KAH9155796.1 hypothetical protein AeRB84_002263 [Aphanomyces euteiches]
MTTFAVSPVQVETFSGNQCSQIDEILTPLKEFGKEGCKEILQGTPFKGSLTPTTSGFVLGAVQAYNQHHDLVIRPDDIWLAIMIQFGFFVNGNAETLRESLVKHQGQKELEVTEIGTLYSVDYGKMAAQMIGKMEEHLVDPTLAQWVLPSFSTTTDHDRIVGSVVMMASMKKYFTYKFSLRCGIPNVTLLGTVQDWENIRSRVDGLKLYGGHMSEWVEMLDGVLDQFVASAKGNVNVDFWQRICHHIGGGSGPRYISGWLSVFCVFNEDGAWQGSTKSVTTWGEETVSDFPIINTNDIPSGYLTVDVTIDDNGVEYKALMFAGHLSYQVEEERRIAPHLSWAIVLKNGEPTSD